MKILLPYHVRRSPVALTRKSDSPKVIVRYMRSTLQRISRGIKEPLIKPPITRGYAVYTINDHDKNSPDAKASTNNPPVGKKKMVHKEVHRARCHIPGCTGTFCIGLCGEPQDTKAIAHVTHGQPPANEANKTTVQAMKGQDFNGNKNKDQNLVFYDDAHNVGQTPIDANMTSKLSDPTIQKIIQNHEDKK